MAGAKELPHAAFYGGIDATPLFLILFAETMKWLADDELYNMEEDPDELRNLASDPAFRDVIRASRDKLLLWLAETVPQVQPAEGAEGQEYWVPELGERYPARYFL